MPTLDQLDEILRGVAAQGRAAEGGVLAQEVGHADFAVGEVAAAPAGDARPACSVHAAPGDDLQAVIEVTEQRQTPVPGS